MWPLQRMVKQSAAAERKAAKRAADPVKGGDGREKRIKVDCLVSNPSIEVPAEQWNMSVGIAARRCRLEIVRWVYVCRSCAKLAVAKGWFRFRTV